MRHNGRRHHLYPTSEGWVYLATVLDCYSKTIVGWALDDHYRASLITKAIHMAAHSHTIPAGAIFHSDRGSNHKSADFGNTLRSLGIRRSVGRAGSSFDNAMAESFFATLKNERVPRMTGLIRQHAIADIATCIELRYNHRRLRFGVGCKNPHEVQIERQNRLDVA
ncbi:transposase InsO family protein [Saccharopolyspora lacisalsi]|uniref:Transposase InsO family protein n=1 Tax=Halosaccharopolyspora lacisalsi TaxID=1000566 RepID=A0A839DUN2_9PSEU|nr:DDE-type integrase/transposase/recombinase [Halosaccharopolyspora lacisalsi]MBA8823976.1 transposase InsO family protein [Halosaccharopolyspora lacisalsi]